MFRRSRNISNQFMVTQIKNDDEIDKKIKELFVACLENNETAIRELIGNGLNVNYKYKYKHKLIYEYTPILILINNVPRNYDLITLLLNSGADINTVDYQGINLLLYACDMCDINLVKLLISHKIDINYQPNKFLSNTALTDACLNDSYDIARFLLENGANPNIQNSVGNTALMELFYDAETSGYINFNIVKLLIEFHTNINIKNEFGSTAVMLLIHCYVNWNSSTHYNEYEPEYEILKYLLEEGYDFNIIDNDGNNLLTCANSDIKIIKIILDYFDQH